MLKNLKYFLVMSSFLTFAHAKPQLIGSYNIPSEPHIHEYAFGGISGIVQDPKNPNEYFAISDARSSEAEGNSRFYKMQLIMEDTQAFSIDVLEAIALKDLNQNLFAKDERDPEAIAMLGNNILWASERSHTIELSNLQGDFVQDFSVIIPSYYYGDNKSWGLRKNQSFEGMSISPGGKYLFVAIETALIQDGDVPSIDKPSMARILKLQIEEYNKLNLIGEYLYEVSKIKTASSYNIHDNGIGDILAIDENTLLVIERNGYAVAEGYEKFDFNIQVFKADLTHASNIMGVERISDSPFKAAEKEVFIDFEAYINRPDNIEAIAFGPNLNGQKTLLFASDNNFQPYQTNQFYLFSYDE